MDDTFKTPFILATEHPQHNTKIIDIKPYYLINNILYHVGKDKKKKICLPETYIERIVLTEHYLRGHSTKQQIYRTLSAKYYHPTLSKRVTALTASCHFCLYARADRQPLQRIKSDYDVINRPRQVWATDLFHGLPETSEKYTSIQLFLDLFSNYVIIIPLRTKNSKELMDNFINYVVTPFSYPAALRSDRESAIRSKVFKDYCHEHGIALLPTAPSSPQTNASAERTVSLVKERLRAVVAYTNQPDWHLHLNVIQQAMNTTVQTYGYTAQDVMFGFTNITPYDLVEFHKPTSSAGEEYISALRTNINVIHADIHKRRQQKRELNEATQNAKRKYYTFAPNDLVTSKSKVITGGSGLRMKYNGPLEILEVSKTMQTASVQHLLTNQENKVHIANLRHMKSLPHHSLLNDAWDKSLLEHQRKVNQ
jgi:transposase InsO family protein